MSNVKFSEDHEWVAVDGEVATIGITDFAQQQLGDVVFVDLPEVGDSIGKGDETGVVESVKAASEVYAPVSGEVLEINEGLEDNPSLVNESAEENGWFYKIKMSDTSQLDALMDADGYEAFTKDEG